MSAHALQGRYARYMLLRERIRVDLRRELPAYVVFSDASFCYKKKLVQEASRPSCKPTQVGRRRHVA